MGPFWASVFLNWKCSICFWGLRASVLHPDQTKGAEPELLKERPRGRGVPVPRQMGRG